MRPVWVAIACVLTMSSLEIKFCITLMSVCLFCTYCEEKIDLEASRYWDFILMSEPIPDDPYDGLAGRILGKGWR